MYVEIDKWLEIEQLLYVVKSGMFHSELVRASLSISSYYHDIKRWS